MMKIKMKTLLAGPHGNANPGDEIDVTVETAAALVSGGYAEHVGPVVERAIIIAPEVAVATAQHHGRRGRK